MKVTAQIQTKSSVTTITYETSFWIPVLGMSITDKHLILSIETLSEIILSAAIKKLKAIKMI